MPASDDLATMVRTLDAPALRDAFRAAEPFPWFVVDDFLHADFARAVRDAFPTYEEACRVGREFRAVNERGKVQVTAVSHLPEPVRRFHALLSSPEWLALLSEVTGVPHLLADETLDGAGLHVYQPGAHLDVHVDFNLITERRLFRRLNILVFFNEGWRPEWGGELELWDTSVRARREAFVPLFNRCVVFETSERSFHGVPRITAPAGVTRRSCAAYYYTREPPPGWDGRFHSTVFRARPEERWKGRVLMPLEAAARRVWRTLRYELPERIGRRDR